MVASPNANGRSLEQLIVGRLAKERAYQLTQRALDAQNRDSRFLNEIDKNLLISLRQSADKIAAWFGSEVSDKQIQVDRTNDSDDGVADIILISNNQSLAYSVKHNSDSLSHLRPYSIAQKLGQPIGSDLDLDHRQRMAVISEKFRKSAGNSRTYMSVPKAKQELYVDTCSETQKTLKKTKDASRVLFESLVGTNFKKIIVHTNATTKALRGISIYDYSSVVSPKTMKTSLLESEDSCRLIVEFDNGWEISLRVHTASTNISSSNQLSLKFDAVALRNTLPPAISLTI